MNAYPYRGMGSKPIKIFPKRKIGHGSLWCNPILHNGWSHIMHSTPNTRYSTVLYKTEKDNLTLPFPCVNESWHFNRIFQTLYKHPVVYKCNDINSPSPPIYLDALWFVHEPGLLVHRLATHTLFKNHPVMEESYRQRVRPPDGFRRWTWLLQWLTLLGQRLVARGLSVWQFYLGFFWGRTLHPMSWPFW